MKYTFVRGGDRVHAAIRQALVSHRRTEETLSLQEHYRAIKPTVVAFASKYSISKDQAVPGKLPHIFGTGFIIDGEGLVMTNNHVIEAFPELPRPKGVHPYDAAVVMLFSPAGDELRTVGMSIKGATAITGFEPFDDFFQVKQPDLGVVGVSITGLPHCKIRQEPGGIVEGAEVGTAGFPMGSRALEQQVGGRLMQMSPFLQKGIVCSLQPFAVPNPMSFAVNILTQNGGSGSPVFLADTGEVVGVAFERRFEAMAVPVVDTGGAQMLSSNGLPVGVSLQMPTNFTYAVPTSHLLADKLEEIKSDFLTKVAKDRQSLEDYFESSEPIDFKTGTVLDSMKRLGENTYIVQRPEQ